MANPKLRIRPIKPTDIPAIATLIRALAKYERLSKHCRPNLTQLRRHAFGKPRYFESLLCTQAGQPIGMAIYFFAYSTFTSSPILFIEDIFVEPTARNQGAGTALMKALARVAIKRSCKQMQWIVLSWNKPAIRFYNRLGARVNRTWLRTRLNQTNLRRLAKP